MNKSDVKNNEQNWIYSQIVKDHFINPRNFVEGEGPDWVFDGMGEVGSPACGDVMRMWIRVEDNIIMQCGWKTFGCASAIASTSVLSEMVIDKTLEEAGKITAKDIVKQLGGLPDNKIHCSVLGDQALRKAIEQIK